MAKRPAASSPSGAEPRVDDLLLRGREVLARLAPLGGRARQGTTAIEVLIRDVSSLIATLSETTASRDLIRDERDRARDEVAQSVGEIRRLRRLVNDRDDLVAQLRGALRALQDELENRRRDLREREIMDENRKAHAWWWVMTLGGLLAVLSLAWAQDRFIGLATKLETGGVGPTGICVIGVILTLALIALCVWLAGTELGGKVCRLHKLAPDPESTRHLARLRAVLAEMQEEVDRPHSGLKANFEHLNERREAAIRDGRPFDRQEEWQNLKDELDDAGRHIDQTKAMIVELEHPTLIRARLSTLVAVGVALLLIIGWYDALDMGLRSRWIEESGGWRVGDSTKIYIGPDEKGQPYVGLDARAPNGHHVDELRGRLYSGRAPSDRK